jgi:hypothetical protein
MMSPFMSFPPDRLDPGKLEAILLRYLAYERLRLIRSRLLPQFAVVLLVCWILTAALHVLPVFTWQAALVLIGVTLASVFGSECCARQRLERELRDASR